MNKKVIKSLVAFAIGAITLVSCDSTVESSTTNSEENSAIETAVDSSKLVAPSSFGEKLSLDSVTSSKNLISGLESSDTLKNIIINGNVESVCKKKGCWMNLQMTDNNQIFVKFKNYGFFVPIDSEGSNAVIQGNAYKETVSVEELQHYAEDDGKSAEEIAAITDTETKYLFMATGVILTDYTPEIEYLDEASKDEVSEDEASEE